ncbi:amidohydrolase [Hephaestia sp. GCM10023244]|uniref:amidohydrolase n=1 Tax=unclassified Hephaestia TaxID=2631281 RepID=UPI002076F08E|nr:amidohydrolase [Hephaestia sp. MAHUQ-44]MCM8731747.1 amidohydrolase [Hephaestia sp. MAHUQ-44]
MAALAALLMTTPAAADALVDNVNGITLDEHGEVVRFTGLLMTTDGRITKLLGRKDKRPEKLDWRTDMHGKVMLPGFVDAHGHIMDLGFRSVELDLSDTRSLAEAQAKIAAYAEVNPERAWILGGGWDQEKWGLGRFPTAAELDALAGGRPIALTRIDSHAVWVNAAALKAAGITPATKAPPGGRIENGILTDAARLMILKVVPQPLARERDMAFIQAQQLLLARGITATADMRTTLDDWLVYRRVADKNLLRIRIMSYADSIRTANRAAGGAPSPWLYEDKLRMGGVKLFADGALGSRGACLKAPYADAPKERGQCVLSDDQLKNLMSRAAMDGFQVAVHAIGDKANAEALDAIEAVSDTYKGDRRWRIEHAQIVDPADLSRFAQGSIIASMQPIHALSDRTMAEARLGPDRLAGAYAWHAMLENHVPLAFGSDYPNDDFNPFHGWVAGFTRADGSGAPFGGWQPQERITREQAWRAYTMGGAYAGFAEDRIGRLAPGLWADFIIVDADPLLATAGELWNMQVEQTWVGGKMMWEKK